MNLPLDIYYACVIVAFAVSLICTRGKWRPWMSIFVGALIVLPASLLAGLSHDA